MHQYYDRTLRFSLFANASFSIVCGTLLVFSVVSADALLSSDVADTEVVGLSLLQVLGIGLVAFGLGVGFVGSRRLLPKPAVKAVVAADALWVVASVALLVFGQNLFTGAGRSVVLVVALIVLAFTLAQLLGMAMLYQGVSELVQSRNGRELHIRVSRRIDAPRDAIWSVMTDHEAYAEFAQNLSSVEIVEGDGLGMVRRCHGTDGTTWTEDAHVWEDGERYGFRIHTDAPDYPYPLERLDARWSIDQTGNAPLIVSMAFSVTPLTTLKGRVFGLVGSFTFPKVLDDILARWQEKMEAAGRERMKAQGGRGETAAGL